MGQSDSILLRRFAKTGDAAAFSEIIKRHAGLVYGACLRILTDADKAADAAQETFLHLLRNAGQITGSVPAWLHKVATGKAADVVRRDHSRKRREAEYIDRKQRQATEWKHVSPYVDEALAELDEQTAEILVRYFFESRSMAEIGAEEGTSRATVSRRIEAGVVELRRKLRGRGVTIAVAVLGSLLAENAAEAVPALVMKELGKLALVGGQAAAGASAAAGKLAASGVLAATKAKIIIAAAVTAAGVGGVLTYNHVTGPVMGRKPDRNTADVAVAKLRELGAVVNVKTSKNGELFTEVFLTGPTYRREWKGGNEGIKYLKELTNLKRLRIQDVEKFSDQGMAHLKGIKSLESLILSRTQVSDDGLIYLKDMTNLEFLGLWSNTQFTDKALDHMKGLTNLKSLRLDDAQITDGGLKKLQEFGLLAPLEFLVLTRTRITDVGLAHLKGMMNLKWLYLNGTGITDEGLAYLEGLETLEVVMLNNTDISDAGLALLKGLPNLNSIFVRNTRLTNAGLEHLKGLSSLVQLWLVGTQITDGGLVYLKGLTKLESLSLERTGVTDAGIAHLKGLTSLKELFLSQGTVTENGHKEIVQALPNCQVSWVKVKARPIKIGDRAPDISIERLVQAPEGAKADWQALRRKIVVLEFWATWCGPCVRAIPHMNELAEKFKDRPVQFISITCEQQSVVEQFLKKHHIEGWIGLDPDRLMATSYGVTGIPDTVVIDKTRRIRAITKPRDLTERFLNELLADGG